MLEGITKSLSGALSVLGKGGKLTEANIREGMRQIREALLEADVNYDVAQEFVSRVTEQAVGDRVLKSLRPSEQIVGIVHEELIRLMGPVDHSLGLKRQGITILMMCGLQGSGKTTTCGKLARMLLQQGRRPMLVAADLQRPAAIEQLKVIGEQVGVPVYSEKPSESTPVRVCRNARREAEKQGDVNVLILDTAGRLHGDEELMSELELIDRKLQPDQALLVCDAMTGQDAVNSAKAFNEALELDGVILAKLDGDTRGGAALSIKAVTGVPIKFVGVGEQLDRLEEFHPDRMAGRILGMGDVLTLVEKAQQEFDEEEMLAQQQKMQEGKFTLDDFRKQMAQIKKLGSMGEIMKLIPGMSGVAEQMADMNPDEDLMHIEAIIGSMTLDERENPDRIDRSRRNRIARGSGSDPSDVNRLLKDFQTMSGVMQKMAGMGMRDRMKALNELKDMGMMDPNTSVRETKQRSKRGPVDRTSIREKRKKERKSARKSRKKNKRKR